MPVVFTATEAGYANGLGRASNSKGLESYHYVQFGRSPDGKPGHQFEFDDVHYRSVNGVIKVAVARRVVEFDLKDQKVIIMREDLADVEWNRFLKGILEVFGDSIIELS